MADSPEDKNKIDLTNILLPKKEPGPTPDSAQRVNAGALLAQEQAATLQTTQAPEPAPAPAPTAPKAQESTVRPLQTYKSDIEGVVQGGASVVSIAAAEAKRKDEQPKDAPAAQSGEPSRWVKIGMIAGGAALLAIAGGITAYIVMRPTTVPVVEAPKAPFIFTDDTALVPVSGATRDALMTELTAARQSTSISLGLIRWLYVTHPVSADTQPQQLTAQELLGTLSNNIPENFLRSLTGQYLLGIHSFDENQAFLLLQVDSYETAYAGMLAWERTMRQDLSPLFTRNPSPKVEAQPQLPATTASTTASSTNQTATSTAATTLPSVSVIIPTSFVDKVVENRDARVIVNQEGDILLLWTFLGRNIVLITTNEYTLREIISRMQNAPVVPTL